jgi:hypothetical protein
MKDGNLTILYTKEIRPFALCVVSARCAMLARLAYVVTFAHYPRP